MSKILSPAEAERLLGVKTEPTNPNDIKHQLDEKRRSIEERVKTIRLEAEQLRKTSEADRQRLLREVLKLRMKADNDFPLIHVKPSEPPDNLDSVKFGESDLVCPICGATDKGNMINGERVCTHDQKEYGAWHKLVPKSELGEYNRKYRRNWKNK